MSRQLVSVVAVALATVVAVGCGEEEQPPTNAEYIKQGDAICKRSDARIQKAGEKAFARLGRNAQPKPEQLTPFVKETVVPEVNGQLEDLRELTPPKGDEDEVVKIYDAAEKALGRLDDDPGLILSRRDPFTAANTLAQDFGFKVCGA